MPAGESDAHLHLKRLALIWAQANGYSSAACEVSLPNLRFRLDVGAYRPGAVKTRRLDARGIARTVTTAALGISVIFECKVSRPDLIRDCRKSTLLIARLKQLDEAKHVLETHLRLNFPSLRQGDGLWPEYDVVAYHRSDHPPYRKVVKAMTTLSRQLHSQTKMENLFKWNAANLHYLVVEPGLIAAHEVPPGWGLLERHGERLRQVCLPEFRELPNEAQLAFLHRVAAAGTKAVNRVATVSYEHIDAERRGVEMPCPTR